MNAFIVTVIIGIVGALITLGVIVYLIIEYIRFTLDDRKYRDEDPIEYAPMIRNKNPRHHNNKLL